MEDSIENLALKSPVIEVSPTAGSKPQYGKEAYKRLYEHSLQDPEGFWSEQAKEYFWYESWTKALSHNWLDGEITTKAFLGAKTNMAVNCLDRHLKEHANKTALLWEANEPGQQRRYSYQEVFEKVCQLANALKALGVKKGDRVGLYMGMVPELAFALLACARIGAIHNVVFGGFSSKSLSERLLDCEASYLLTCDGLYRGSKTVSLKNAADAAMKDLEDEGKAIKACLCLKRTGEAIQLKKNRDYDWESFVGGFDSYCEALPMDSEAPLFLLYTSGSTGKPKGVIHSTGGYMVYVGLSFKTVFCVGPEDRYFCTADIGWITGHSYLLYGALLNGATTVMFEGVPNYPKPDRFWDMIDRHQITHLYTAPTAIRALMREGDAWLKKYQLSSLKHLGTVGEPINPEAWNWYFEKVGKKRCPIVDTWWQTETGGIVITTPPWSFAMKPGAAGFPFFGIKPEVLKESGETCKKGEGGSLVLSSPWPAISRGVYGQPDRLKETYFSRFPGKYLTGDGAYQDQDGYYWILGRLDDVLNVSGHRLGTSELESALVKHPKVVEAAVVGISHEIKGQGIYAFVTLAQGETPSEDLAAQLKVFVAKEISPIAKPDRLQFAPALPKTRSGKIMRRLLRKIAEGHAEDLGDTSTLADPQVVEVLVAGRDSA